MSISKFFIPNFLCVLTNESDTKHIRHCFYSVAWVMHQGWDLRALGVPRGSKKHRTWSCGISNRRGWRAEQNASNIFTLGSSWWPWGEVKKSNIINMSISKISIPKFVCVFTNKRWKTYWTEFSFCCQVHAPGWDWGCRKLKRGDLRWRPIDCAL